MSLLTLIAAPALAQQIKPGLYQVTSKVGGNNQVTQMMKQQQETLAKMTPEQRQQMADMPKQMERMMANMSPAQREQMKAAMGDKAGALDAMQSMQLRHNADGTTSMKMCVTQEMIDRRNFRMQQGDCKQSNGDLSGGVMKFSYTCTTPPSKGEGELRITGPNSFTTNVKMTSTDPANKQTMELNATSTWLGAACGNVKPMDASALKSQVPGQR